MRMIALALAGSPAGAHHVEVLGFSLPHSAMGLPATLFTALGLAAVKVGRRGLGAALCVVSVPLWLIAFDLIA